MNKHMNILVLIIISMFSFSYTEATSKITSDAIVEVESNSSKIKKNQTKTEQRKLPQTNEKKFETIFFYLFGSIILTGTLKIIIDRSYDSINEKT